MNREEIIRMAREAGINRCTCARSTCDMLKSNTTFQHLARFAALVAAAEREACAKVCEELRDEDGYEAWNTECAAAIRERGNHAA